MWRARPVFISSTFADNAGGARALQSLSTVTVYGCAKRE
jgi:hypothetical protein